MRVLGVEGGVRVIEKEKERERERPIECKQGNSEGNDTWFVDLYWQRWIWNEILT